MFAPNSKLRAQVTSSKWGKGSHPKAPDETQNQTPAERRAAMTWAQRLKRVFRIEIEICQHGGRPVLQIFRGSRRSNGGFLDHRRSGGGRFLPYAVQDECSFWTLGESTVHDPEPPFVLSVTQIAVTSTVARTLDCALRCWTDTRKMPEKLA